jgi:hypothetical protein
MNFQLFLQCEDFFLPLRPIMPELKVTHWHTKWHANKFDRQPDRQNLIIKSTNTKGFQPQMAGSPYIYYGGSV